MNVRLKTAFNAVKCSRPTQSHLDTVMVQSHSSTPVIDTVVIVIVLLLYHLIPVILPFLFALNLSLLFRLVCSIQLNPVDMVNVILYGCDGTYYFSFERCFTKKRINQLLLFVPVRISSAHLKNSTVVLW